MLRDAGFDMDLDGRDSIGIQNVASNSVRVNDAFMRAYEAGASFDLRAVLDGSTMETLPARDLMREIAQAAWGRRPGHAVRHHHQRLAHHARVGPDQRLNPCFTGETLVHTDKGLVRFDELTRRAVEGETFGIYTHDATNPTPRPRRSR